jgi:hypothetical protein
MVDLPLDVLYLITNVVGELPHPLSYKIDSGSLRALCLVSRLFNTVATPILYSSITLSTWLNVVCLVKTAESNPKLLTLCHSLYWPGSPGRQPYAEQKILTAMTGLRRFLTLRMSGYPLEILPNSTTIELAFPEVSFSELCRRQFYTHTFANLERLVIGNITLGHSHGTPPVTHFLKMPRLTHVAITNIDPTYPDKMIDIIKYTPPLCRIIFCLSPCRVFKYDAFRSRILELLPERRDVHVVFLTHWIWFTARIVDGTLWEMDSMEPS